MGDNLVPNGRIANPAILDVSVLEFSGMVQSCRVKAVVQVLSGLVGLAAAILWFKSAAGPIPLAPGAEIGGTLPSDPFNVALRHSATLNEWAAGATGLSVLLSVASLAVDPIGAVLRRIMDNEPHH